MKDIKGFEGRYAVTKDGKVWSYPKSWITKNQYGVSHTVSKGGYWLKFDSNFGYNRVCLSKNGKTKRLFVHRLVAMAFIENIDNKPQINHKNGIKNDNRVDNLEWVTSSENILHCFRELGRKPNKAMLGIKGIRHVQSQQVAEISDKGEIIHVYGGLADCDRVNCLPLNTTASFFNKGLRKTHGKRFIKISKKDFLDLNFSVNVNL